MTAAPAALGEARVCGDCGAVHVTKEAAPCPACRGETTPLALPEVAPEWVRRRTVDRQAAARALQRGGQGVWFRCPDADPGKLAGRLLPVWWPYWLVDVDAHAIWQAEVGFDYEVKSSVETYQGGRWSSREKTETRTRWEPRVGTLQRRYPDVAVAGLGDQPFFFARLTVKDAVPFEPGLVEGPVRVPDRTPAEQWPVALDRVRWLVGEDCAKAAGADRVRETYLDLDPSQAAWTWLLVPGWVTWYADDDGKPHVLRVDGTDGGVEGEWLASPALGRWWALVHAGVGVSLLLAAALTALVGLVLWFLMPVALILAVLGIAEGVVAAWCAWTPGRTAG